MSKAVTFKDKVKVFAVAGRGGNGCMSFRREKYVPLGGPDGGDGGRGGHIYLRADKDTDSLVSLYFEPIRRAEHGGHGKGKQCTGKEGKDLYLKVPCGTTVRDADTDEILGEVVQDQEELLVARGGKGGVGNIHFKTSSHQAPREHTPGEPGEERNLWMELKLVADVALVGYPNAGKSTLLTKISDAHPKIAAYPFTTLNPIIGTVIYEDYRKLRVADVPGLIEGAHQGVGLGHDFLRHIERSSFLVLLIDMAGVDGRGPVGDYRHLLEELKLYRAELLDRPRLLVANKMDLDAARDNLTLFIRETGETPLPISASTGDGTDRVKAALHRQFFEIAT